MIKFKDWREHLEERIKELSNHGCNCDINPQSIQAALNEIDTIKEELQRIQRLPHMDKASASAVIMQVAAQLVKMFENQKAKNLKNAVDKWTIYTSKVEAERDKLFSLLQLSSNSLRECLQHVDYHSSKADKIRDILQKINKMLR